MLNVDQIDSIAGRATYNSPIGANIITRTEIVQLCLIAREAVTYLNEAKIAMERADLASKMALNAAENITLDRAAKRSLEREKQKTDVAIQMRDEVMTAARRQQELNQRLVLGFTRALDLSSALCTALHSGNPAEIATKAVELEAFIKSNEA